MRICSLLPSATEIIAGLGLVDLLVGVSKECDWPPRVRGKPIVTAARLDPATLDSAEIDRRVRESVADGTSLYALDGDLIEALQPDLIVTQDLCTVCAISTGQVRAICAVDAEVISLDPMSLGEVAGSIRILAGRLGASERGEAMIDRMRATVEGVRTAVAGLPRRRVFVAEWIDPPYCAGHWVPEMVEAAGGLDVLGMPGRASYATTWEDVLAARPELVVVAACGFDAAEGLRRAEGLELPCRTVVVDGDAYYSRPGPRLAEGVRQLGHLLHPSAVPDPELPAHEVISRLS